MNITIVTHPYLDRFSNSYILETSAGPVLIDTGLKSGIPMITREAEKPIAVLSTHGHWDHMGGTSYFQEQGIPVYVHPADAPVMLDLDLQWDMLYEQFKEDFDIPPERRLTYVQEAGDPIKKYLPLEDGQTLRFGDAVIRVIHTPGHSAGSVCFYLEEEGALFTGDTVSGAGFYNGLPQISDLSAYRRTLEKISHINADRIYSCHTAGIMDGETCRQELAEGLKCFDRLEAWTKEYLDQVGEKKSLRDLAAHICLMEGGKAGGSGALVAAAACLREFASSSPAAKECCEKYIL